MFEKFSFSMFFGNPIYPELLCFNFQLVSGLLSGSKQNTNTCWFVYLDRTPANSWGCVCVWCRSWPHKSLCTQLSRPIALLTNPKLCVHDFPGSLVKWNFWSRSIYSGIFPIQKKLCHRHVQMRNKVKGFTFTTKTSHLNLIKAYLHTLGKAQHKHSKGCQNTLLATGDLFDVSMGLGDGRVGEGRGPIVTRRTMFPASVYYTFGKQDKVRERVKGESSKGKSEHRLLIFQRVWVMVRLKQLCFGWYIQTLHHRFKSPVEWHLRNWNVSCPAYIVCFGMVLFYV